MKKKVISTLMCLLMCCSVGSQVSMVASAEDTTNNDTLVQDINIDYSSHDLTLIYLGDNIFYRLVDDYFMYGSTEEYYLENNQFNVGDIVGVNLNADNEQSKDYNKNLILESSYSIELIQASNPQTFAEDETPVFFGTVSTIFSEHSMEITLNGEQDGLYKFYINTTEPIPSELSRGSSLVFTVDELYSSFDNATVVTSNFVSKSDYVNGITVGYNSSIDATVIEISSSTDDNIGNYLYIYGIQCDAGYSIGTYYLPPFIYIADNLYVSDFYEVSSVGTTLSQEPDNSNAITKEGIVLGRYSDNGAYIKLSEYDGNIYPYIYLANNVSSDIEVGDTISFDLLNKVYDANYCTCYYSDNVSIVKKHTEDSLIGDVNLDGSINVLDFLTLKNYILYDYTKKDIPENADINRDTSINILDLFLLKRMILGLN